LRQVRLKAHGVTPFALLFRRLVNINVAILLKAETTIDAIACGRSIEDTDTITHLWPARAAATVIAVP
jgi:hypothetical protein